MGQLLTLGADGSSNGQVRAYNLLNTHVPEYDVPVVLVNDTKYGGSGGPISVASIHSLSGAIVEHEIGHSFALLADEYDQEFLIYSPSEMPNNTAQTTRSLIRWNHWIDASTPVPTAEIPAYENAVGLFEGSMYRTTGWYRPHYDSLMKSLNRPCGPVNREQFVLQIYNRVSPLEGFAPASTSFPVSSPSSLSFQVTPKSPTVGPALQVTWKIDSVVQSGQTSGQFSKLSDYLGNGSHSVSATVQDPTAFVRLDPGGLLRETVTWNLSLSGQIPTTLTGWRNAYGADTAVNSSDGLSNLIKYGLGLNANVAAAPNQKPVAGLTSDSGEQYLTLTIPRRMRRTDVSYVVEVSSEPGMWSSGPGQTVVLQDTDTLLVVRDAQPISAHSKRFIHLAVLPLP